MSTRAQRRAARHNSELSTGPRSTEGKAVSAQNARTHGLTISDQSLARQQAPALNQLIGKHTRSFNPQNEAEHELVRQLSLATLRLRSTEQAESHLQERLAQDPALFEDDDFTRALTRLERYRASAERTFQRTYRELAKLAAKPQNETKPAKPEIDFKPLTEALRLVHHHRSVVEEVEQYKLDHPEEFIEGHEYPEDAAAA